MRILVLGDIVGRPGRDAVSQLVPGLRESWGIDLVIANAENAAAGSGITPRLFRELAAGGVELMTLGDHAWKRRDNVDALRKYPNLLRPHNYPEVAAGTGVRVLETSGGDRVALVTVLGRIFLGQVDCPFQTVEKVLDELPSEVRIRFVEIHAEATSEKIALGWHLAGRVSCVFGTHTHVPTADDRILPGGTAFITDLGMTGPYDGVIGRDRDAVIHKFTTSMHATFHVAEGNVHLCGILVDVDQKSGEACALRRVDLSCGESASAHGSSPPLTSVDGPSRADPAERRNGEN